MVHNLRFKCVEGDGSRVRSPILNLVWGLIELNWYLLSWIQLLNNPILPFFFLVDLASGVRASVWENFQNNPLFDISTDHTPTYYEDMQRSVFCLCPVGWAPWSPRLVEAVVLGCIPVIIADDIVLPFAVAIPWEEIGVVLAEGTSPSWTQSSRPWHLKWYWGSYSCWPILQWSGRWCSLNQLSRETVFIRYWMGWRASFRMTRAFTWSQGRGFWAGLLAL